MNCSGRWPVLVETEDGAEIDNVIRVDFARGKRSLPLSPYDLAQGMPEVVEAIDTRTLAVMIFVTGVIVVIGGCVLAGS
ncbi:hypothetical protein EP7_004276 [Isosphaeraceae bacterium EP7]